MKAPTPDTLNRIFDGIATIDPQDAEESAWFSAVHESDMLKRLCDLARFGIGSSSGPPQALSFCESLLVAAVAMGIKIGIGLAESEALESLMQKEG